MIKQKLWTRMDHFSESEKQQLWINLITINEEIQLPIEEKEEGNTSIDRSVIDACRFLICSK